MAASSRKTGSTLAAVAASGNRRETLEKLRDVIAETITAGVEPKDLAALSRRLEVVTAEIEAMGGGRRSGESIADALAERRNRRASG
jgi:hypothetical protein